MDTVTGQELYEVYLEGLKEQDCEADPWDMLSDLDKYAWEVVATHVRVNS